MPDLDIQTCLEAHNAKDLLRFITCGSVDDGKSTLIGRLLLEAGAIYDDQIAALQHESAKHGTTGARIDTALLLDGLEDERQQGITIDVAYRYFTSANRKFIIADTPGHEQFTRNMATGASTAQLAIILVDATKGISDQTRRHATIVSLLGISHVVLAVNKMDLVGFSEEQFSRIVEDFRDFSTSLNLREIYPIPLSALEGDNVVSKSERMAWYHGTTLFDYLCSVDVSTEDELASLRFPVQWVNRPDSSFRGFSGTVASGELRVDDEVLALPSGRKARVKSIVTMDGDLPIAKLNDSVTVTLDREIDITRGDMLVNPTDPPLVTTSCDANVVWMSSQPLVPGKRYWLKHTTRRTSCEIAAIRYRTEVNTLRRLEASTLKLNEIGCCSVKVTEPLMLDSYSRNRQTGSFIIVDRITHETVGAGMFVEAQSSPETSGHWEDRAATMASPRWQPLISSQDRIDKYRHRPLTVLITGLSGSGKTSVAMALERMLFDSGATCVLLDGQLLRLGISRDLSFSAEERSENLRRAAEIAKILNDSGQICIAAFVAPSEWVRHKVKQLLLPDRVLHVHLTTPVEVCRQRDQSGQYRAAEKGEISNFPGVTVPYEQPTDADLVFDGEVMKPDSIADQIFTRIKALSFLS
jgi:bifunctional enzyme CysN/CysC